MNDKNNYDDEDVTEESDDKTSGGFDSGKELRGFPDDDEPHQFDTKEAKGEGYLPDFTDEMEYTAMAREKKGVFSKLLTLPSISIGWLGLLLIVLVGLFLFLPDVNRSFDSKQIAALSERVKSLEEQWAQMPKSTENADATQANLPMGKETTDRMNALEQKLTATTDELKRDMGALNFALADIKSKMTTEKATVARKSMVEKTAPGKKQIRKASPVKTAQPEKITYHKVKAGENLYRIALKYGLKESELLRLNSLGKNAVIRPGQKLRVSK